MQHRHSIKTAALLAAVFAASNALAQTTQPSTAPSTQPAAAEIDAAIAKLASADFKERVAAHQWLHDHLTIAEPAIRQMLASTHDAESKRRGLDLLDDAEWGFDVDVPQSMRDAVKSYANGESNNHNRLSLLSQLRELTGSWRGPVALKLLASDAIENERSELAVIVSEEISTVVNRAVASGKLPELLHQFEEERDERLLREAVAIRMALTDPAATPAALAQTKATEAKLSPEERFFLTRARDDMPAALEIARDGTYPQYEPGLLAEMGRWADLAALMKHENKDRDWPAAYAVAQAFAADGLMPDADAAKLKADAADKDTRHNPQYALVALLVGGRMDEAVDTASAQGAYDIAARLLLWKDKVADAKKLVDAAFAEKKQTASYAAVIVGSHLWEQGQKNEAEALFKRAENAVPVSAAAINQLYAFREKQDQTAEARALLLRALVRCTPDQFIIMAAAAHPDWDSDAWREARGWWFTLEASQPDLALDARLALVERIIDAKVTAKELEQLVTEAKPYAGNIRGLTDIDTMMMTNLTEQRLARLRGDPPKDDPDEDPAARAHFKTWSLMNEKAADQLADPDKSKLAAFFADLVQNRDLAGDRPVLIYMQGWALARAGRPEGAALMRSAQVSMAASWQLHHGLMMLLGAYGDPEAAIAEQRRVTEYAREDYDWFASYGTLVDQLRNLHPEQCVEPFRIDVWSLLRERENGPSDSVRGELAFALDAGDSQITRLSALVSAGKTDEAFTQAKVLRDHWLVRDEEWASLVRSFNTAGKKDQATALMELVLAQLRPELTTGGDPAGANNDYAWTLARARMDLDSALRYALKAVELAPAKSAFQDTLAEIYWAQGDRDKAVATEQKAATLDVKDKLFKKRIEHFKNDKLGSMDIVEE